MPQPRCLCFQRALSARRDPVVPPPGIVIPGYRVIGSAGEPEAATGEVRVRMTRNGRLRYRSGSSSGQYLAIVGHEREFASRLPGVPEWVLLEFGNTSLPERFVVRIEDRGPEPEQWSAVAIREQQAPSPASTAKP